MADKNVKKENKEEAEKKVTEQGLQERPPVVAVLGHVDHGKTTLLDSVRTTSVVEGESGGITQHIGAYEVEVNGRKITFIDTPGHEAFSAMRERGAKVADIAILVVDASESVKAQTKEAIKFIKKAEIPMIVALNKMDKPSALPEKVKQELSKNDVVVESYGGKEPCVEVSAKSKKGIDELLETILLVAEVEELKMDISSIAEGTIIESHLDAQKGPIATLIPEKGILKIGDITACGSCAGKIKRMEDFLGKEIEQALPSQPVSVSGFETAPSAGDRFKVYDSIEEANQAVESVKQKPKQVSVVEEGKQVLKLILKTDVLGSGEAIENILNGLPQEKVVLQILKLEAGDISVGDVRIAESSNAVIFGFRVKADEQAKVFARQKEVRIKIYDVIYEMVQEIRKAMTGELLLETKRIDLGKFKITHLFKQGKDSQIIGGKVMDGEITQNTFAEIKRGDEIIGKGRIKGLQQNKKEVGKVARGKEAGLKFNSDIVVEENDFLLIYREEKQKGVL